MKKQMLAIFRRDMAFGPMDYLVSMLNNRYLGENLSDDQKSCVYEYLTNSDNTYHAGILKFKLQCL